MKVHKGSNRIGNSDRDGKEKWYEKSMILITNKTSEFLGKRKKKFCYRKFYLKR